MESSPVCRRRARWTGGARRGHLFAAVRRDEARPYDRQPGSKVLPQGGLDKAQIIFEVIVEGGLKADARVLGHRT